APLLLFTVRDPRRGATDPVVPPDAAPPLDAAPVAQPLPPHGSARVGVIASAVMLCLGVLALVAGAVSAFVLGEGGRGLTLASAGLLAVVIGASLMIARSTASAVIPKKSFWLLALGAASSSIC